MRWVLVAIGIVVVAVGVLSQYRYAVLEAEWEEHNREALRLAAEREAQAKVQPGQAMLIYERPEDPSLKAIDSGEFYLLLAPAVWYVIGGILAACGVVVLVLTRRPKKAKAGANQSSV